MLCLSGFQQYSRWVPLIWIAQSVTTTNCCKRDGTLFLLILRWKSVLKSNYWEQLTRNKKEKHFCPICMDSFGKRHRPNLLI